MVSPVTHLPQPQTWYLLSHIFPNPRHGISVTHHISISIRRDCLFIVLHSLVINNSKSEVYLKNSIIKYNELLANLMYLFISRSCIHHPDTNLSCLTVNGRLRLYNEDVVVLLLMSQIQKITHLVRGLLTILIAPQNNIVVYTEES